MWNHAIQWGIVGVLSVTSAALEAQASPAAWAAADELFQRDLRWAGGDGVSSVELRPGAILWLFADSFVRRSDGRERGNSVMVRNSIAVQEGLDPATSRVQFFWRETPTGPESYFYGNDSTWFWPGAAARVDSAVLVFLMHVRAKPDSTGGVFGFEVFDWQAVAIRDAVRGPEMWSEHRVRTVSNPFQVIVGSGGALRHGDYLYAFGARESAGTHPVFVTRWPVSSMANLDLSDPEWWCGPAMGWIRQSELTGWPVPVFDEGQTEFSVHRDPRSGRFIMTQSVGFGSAQLGFRFSENIEGPWSSPRIFYRPPESDNPELFVYAGKAHPEWSDAGLVVSYVANAWDFWRMADDQTIYYPRFVRVPHLTIERLAEDVR